MGRKSTIERIRADRQESGGLAEHIAVGLLRDYTPDAVKMLTIGMLGKLSHPAPAITELWEAISYLVGIGLLEHVAAVKGADELFVELGDQAVREFLEGSPVYHPDTGDIIPTTGSNAPIQYFRGTTRLVSLLEQDD